MPAPALAEHLGEDAAHVDEGLMAARMLVLAATAARLVAIETARRHLLARAVDFARVEAPALLGIGEDVVGLPDFLELGFGRLVAGIEVGMVFLGELAERLADVVLGGGPRHAQDGIGIGHSPTDVQ